MAASGPTKIFHHDHVYFERADALPVISMFIIGSLVYGLYIPLLGFYWDDWPVVWVYNALGPGGVAKYFAGQRPVYGWIIANLAQFLGISPIGWHVVSLVVRCASSAVLFVAFSALWPRRKDVAWLVGTFVLLYPAFTLQPIALGFLEYHLSFLFFVFSLAATIFSIATPAYRWLFLPISLLTEGFSYLLMEYFLGLELFRFFVIVVLKNPEGETWNHKKLGTALAVWSPYATLWIAYVVWRGFVFRAASGVNVGTDVSQILRNPIPEVLERVLGELYNILIATVLAWARPFSQDFIAPSRSGILSWAIATVVVGIAIYTLWRMRTSSQNPKALEPSDDASHHFAQIGLLLGLAGLGVAGLTLLVPDLRAEFIPRPSFHDRFTLVFMLPASLMLSCLLTILGIKRLSKLVLLSLLLFAFSAFQVQNASLYHRDWLAQKSLFWQLAWRAPILKQGTSIFVDGLPLSLYANHSAGLLNLLYNRDDSAGHLDYFIFDLSRLSLDKSLGAGSNPSFKPGEVIYGRVRTFQFQGNTTQSLVSWISSSGTFRIVTQPYANESLRSSALCINVSYLSQPVQVIRDAPGLPGGPLLKIFGSEPKHEWLYFYQKAELERQLKNWAAVAALGDEAIREGYKPTDPSEWFPFIEGYARTNRYGTAVEISNKVLEEAPDGLPALSALWQRVRGEGLQNSTELDTALGALRDKLMLRNGK